MAVSPAVKREMLESLTWLHVYNLLIKSKDEEKEKNGGMMFRSVYFVHFTF